MKKFLVTTLASTVIVVAAASPAAFADTTSSDTSQSMTAASPSDSTAPATASGNDASGQLQPAGTGTGAVPAPAQVDAATLDQIRADAAPLGNYQPVTKPKSSALPTLIGFVAGLILGGAAVMVGLRLFRSAPKKS